MALYEVGIVLSTNHDEQDREAFLAELREVLAGQKATIVKQDVWGKRMLAYEIDHQREGFYLFWQFEGEGPAVKALEYRLRLSEPVLRYMTLNLDREMQRSRKMERVRAKQKAAKAAKEAAALAGGEA